MGMQLQLRRDTAANWASVNPVLAAGEMALSTDTKTVRIGDGSSTWSALPESLGVLVDTYLDEDADLLFGAGPGKVGVLEPSTSASRTVIQANSSAPLGVSRVNLSTGIVSDLNVSSAVSGDLLKYNSSTSKWEPVSFSTFINSVDQRTLQNVALRQAGYFSQGYFSQTVYKWAFPADTVSTTTSAPDYLSSGSGFANPGIAGYFSQGYYSSTVYKWAFPADTVSTTTSSPQGMDQHAGFSNPSVAGYFSQGYSAVVYRWAFPSDIVSTTTSAPTVMYYESGFANPSVAGYVSRGFEGTQVYKWAFPANTVSTTTSSPTELYYNAGFANPAVAGYFSRPSNTIVYKWAFPTDTVTTTTSAPETMVLNAGFANPSVAGYFAQGFGGPYNTNTPAVFKWAFPSDTVSVTTSAPDALGSATEVSRQFAGFANA